MARLPKARLAKVAGWQRQARRRPTVRVGDRDAVMQGVKTRFWDDFRYRSLTASWPVFVAGAAVAFLLLNGLFALAYYLGDDPVANVPPGSFLHDLYFSIETIATVGYGGLHPPTHYGHILASGELVPWVFSAALLTE